MSSKIKPVFWPCLALLIAGTIGISSLFLIHEAPLPANWDEALYLGRSYHDLHALQDHGLRGLISALHYGDMVRPPAYRFFVIPWNSLFGVDLTTLRLHALFFWAVTLFLVYLTGKKLSGRDSGAFAVIYLTLCPFIISGGYWFGTEYPLYFSAALLFYALTNIIQDNRQRVSDAFLIIFATALGGLSKLSFYFLLGPLALGLLVLGLRDSRFYPRPFFVITTLGIGNLLILPWWRTNYRDVLDFTFHVTATFERHSLGQGISLSKFFAWLRLLQISTLGPSVACITLLLLAVTFLQWRSFPSLSKKIISIFLLSALPTMYLSFSGTNNNPRYTTLILFPVVFALGMAASNAGWLTAPLKRRLLAVLFIGQLMIMVWPTAGNGRYQQDDPSQKRLVGEVYSVMFRRLDQWDWAPLREKISAHGITNPVIGQMGAGKAFHPPGILLPWIQHREKADVRQLWRYEKGPLEWDKLLEDAQQCNVLVTAPYFKGRVTSKDPLDNQYNAEFTKRVEASGLYEPPVELTIGKWEPEKVLIFMKRR